MVVLLLAYQVRISDLHEANGQSHVVADSFGSIHRALVRQTEQEQIISHFRNRSCHSQYLFNKVRCRLATGML